MAVRNELKSGGKKPTGTIKITTNGITDVTDYANANVQVTSEDAAVVKALAEGTLTSFKASDYNITSLAESRFKGFSDLTSLDLTGVLYIRDYTAANCYNLSSLILDPNTTTIRPYAFHGCDKIGFWPELEFTSSSIDVGENAFYNVLPKTIKGVFSSIGNYAFYGNNNIVQPLEEINIKVLGAIESSAFQSKKNINSFTLDPTSVITSIGTSAFSIFGSGRTSPENNVFIFDLRNSIMSRINNSTFGGLAWNNKNVYFDIYLPQTVIELVNSCFAYSDYFNIFYKNIPSMTTNVFYYATNFKNFFPYNLTQTAKISINWASSTYGINDSIYGYSDTNEFNIGDTLPETDSNGYALTWYSDRSLTTQVTTVTNADQMYYCSVGAKLKVKLSLASYQATCIVSDGINIYNNNDLIPIGSTITITASGDAGYSNPYIFTLNGSNITSGDTYTITANDTSIDIACVYYDGVNIPFEATFANNTPAQIKTAVDNGLHRLIWTIGDTKSITVNNIPYTLRYIDQMPNRYQKSDNSGYSNAVFELVELYTTSYLNATNSSIGGWPATYGCQTLMPQIFNNFSSDWQSIISEVKVASSSGNLDPTLTWANNKIFIAAAQELFLNYSNAYFEDSPIFDYYNNTTVSRIKYYNGINTTYFTRSPSSSGNTLWAVVSNNYLTTGGVSSNLGIPIYFAI